jgi:hypothetical protein
MSKVIQFIARVNPKPTPGPFTCSLNRALLTVQYCALVLQDNETACEILQIITEQIEPLSYPVTLPGKYREIVEGTDTAATYRAVLGVINHED